MKSLILSTVTRFMMPLLLMVSLFLLIQGHEAPGGGFIAGLMGASAFSIYALAFGIAQVKEAMHIEPRSLLGIGILISLLSGTVGMFNGKPFLTGEWLELDISHWGPVHIGTPMIFDVGVYLVVLGMATSVITSIAEE